MDCTILTHYRQQKTRAGEHRTMPGLCCSVSSQSRGEAAPYATGSSNTTQGAGENQASLLNPKRFNNPQLKAGVGLVSFYCNRFSPASGKSSVVRVFLKGASPCTHHLGSSLPCRRARECPGIISCEQEIKSCSKGSAPPAEPH